MIGKEAWRSTKTSRFRLEFLEERWCFTRGDLLDFNLKFLGDFPAFPGSCGTPQSSRIPSKFPQKKSSIKTPTEKFHKFLKFQSFFNRKIPSLFCVPQWSIRADSSIIVDATFFYFPCQANEFQGHAGKLSAMDFSKISGKSDRNIGKVVDFQKIQISRLFLKNFVACRKGVAELKFNHGKAYNLLRFHASQIASIFSWIFKYFG